jgi:probable HAF family extracellular repeat protein
MKNWGVAYMGLVVTLATALGGEFNKAAGIVVAKGISDDGTAVILRTAPGAQEWGYRWKPPDPPLILGDLPGGAERTRPLAISGDGTCVVGWSSSSNGDSEAFRWTIKGMEALGDLVTGRFQSKATGTTHDGKVVIGEGTVSMNNLATPQAVVWNDEGWITGMGFLPGGYDRTYAIDCSADGGIIVGSGFSENGSQTWRWDSVNLLVDIGPIPVDGSQVGRQTAPLACSDDGTQMAGLGYDLQLGWNYGPTHLWFWDVASGFTVLAEARGGDLQTGGPAVFGSNALVSDDMSTIVAPYSGGSSSGILRWDAIMGISELETQGKLTTITDISAEGKVVVGSMTDMNNTSHAVLWGADGQMKILKEFLEEARTDTGDYELTTAAAVSDDGRAIAGQLRWPTSTSQPPITPPWTGFGYSTSRSTNSGSSPTGMAITARSAICSCGIPSMAGSFAREMKCQPTYSITGLNPGTGLPPTCIRISTNSAISRVGYTTMSGANQPSAGSTSMTWAPTSRRRI